jgi:DNA modification methylase
MTPMFSLPERSITTLDWIHQSDALSLLRALPDNYVNCIVTSPPYFGLRNYNVTGQIGLEDTMQAYIARLVAVFREARRVLRDDGAVWVNMGDSYGTGGSGQNFYDPLGKRPGGGRTVLEGGFGHKKQPGIRGMHKQLLGVPWRLAFALQDDGYYLRQDIIWAKPNPMPESCTDRCTKAHEYVFLLSKSPRYWYDADAIREAQTGDIRGRKPAVGTKILTTDDNLLSYNIERMENHRSHTEIPGGRNKRSVWTVATEPAPFAHFATFPQALITPMIQAGCPAQVCSVCGAPYERDVEKGELVARTKDDGKGYKTPRNELIDDSLVRKNGRGFLQNHHYETIDRGFRPTCDHTDAPTRPGIVLDMFGGSGTTGLVAMRLGRHYIMSDLSPEYVALARRRLATADPYQPTPISETGETQLSLFEVTP